MNEIITTLSFTYVWFVFIRYTRSRDKQLWSRRNIM